jgi:hypothetical protein
LITYKTDIKYKTQGGNQIKPEKETKKIAFLNKRLHNYFYEENYHHYQSDIVES